MLGIFIRSATMTMEGVCELDEWRWCVIQLSNRSKRSSIPVYMCMCEVIAGNPDRTDNPLRSPSADFNVHIQPICLRELHRDEAQYYSYSKSLNIIWLHLISSLKSYTCLPRYKALLFGLKSILYKKRIRRLVELQKTLYTYWNA